MSAHFSGIRSVLPPVNEPIKSYAPGSPEKASLKARLASMAAETIDIPLVIGGKEIRTGDLGKAVMPHKHGHVLATYHHARPKDVHAAIAAAQAAKAEWASWPWEDRAAVFLKAADLLATSWRDTLNAATMLNQSKTVYQSEIDAACELIDFWRYNVAFAAKLYAEQPRSPAGVWNLLDHRPLEGFVLAVSPFNFTSIAANLPTAPALLGNTVVWKPSVNATYSAHFILGLLREAGLPDGVVNMVLGDPATLVDAALQHPDLAGVHFTGSTAVFQRLWATVGGHVGAGRYRTYPRLVGETGGKDFVFAHPSADVETLAVALLRGAYEYQGQKCSAASRAFVPASLWPSLRTRLGDMIADVRVGDPTDYGNFLGAVIDRVAFDRLGARVDAALADPQCEVLHHGRDDRTGFFLRPTLVRTDDPGHALLRDELFGPVLTVWVYPDAELDAALDRCDRATPYGLTGAFFARDRAAIAHATTRLRHAAGNFYINDKPTGAVVGQQPFGGGRLSGTNDKAGSVLNLLRWVSPRTIKETLCPATDWRYPSMG